MYRISVTLFLVGFLIGAITAADDQPDCGAQYFDQFKCMMAIKESDEIKAIMEKKKPILQTCAPDYPKSCIEEWETMESCCKKLSAKWEDDPECVALKNETMTKVNTCFATEPHDPMADLEELFMPPGMSGHHHKGKGPMGKEGKGKESKEKSAKSGEKPVKSGEKSEGGKGKEKEEKAKEKEEPKKDKREAKGNETSAASEEEEEDDGPPPMPPPPFMKRKECMKTKSQMACVAKELSKSDAAFTKAIETLLQKKEDCEQKVKHVCKLTTGPLKKCFWKAHENIFKKIFEKMETCMKAGKSEGGEKGKEETKEGKEKPKEGASSNSTSEAKEKSSRK